jgi:hypothetical protein
MRKILAVVMLAVFAAALTAQPDKIDTAKDGKFTAKFPNGPAVFKKSAGGLALTTYRADYEKGKGGYVVFYTDIPPEVLKAPLPAKVLETAENALKDDFKATIKESSAIEFGPKKYPARKLTAEKMDITGEWNLRGMMILTPSGRLYQVYVYGPKDFLASKDADAFLSSFEITE